MANKLFYLLKIIILFGFYFGTAWAGLKLNAVSGFATLVWPPTGIALTALLLFGYRLWPGIFLGALLINWQTGAPFLVAFGIGIGNTLEPVIGAYLLKRIKFNNSIEKLANVLWFIFFAALVSTLISATIGVGSLWLGGVISSTAIAATWIAWWIGDVLGNLIVASFLLVWLTKPKVSFDHWRPLESVFLGITLILVGLTVFGNFLNIAPTAPTAYFVFIPLIWAALRFGQRGTTAANLVVSFLAILGILQGGGPFITESLSKSLTLLQIFMGVVSATTLIMAAVVTERRKALEELREAAQQFIKLFEENPVGMVMIYPNGKIFRANKAYCEMLGYKEEELRLLSVAGVTPPADTEETNRLIKAVFSGEISDVKIEKRYITKSGNTIWVRITASPVRDEFGRPMYNLAIAENITEQKRDEEEINRLNKELGERVVYLQKEQAKDYAILESIGDGLVVVDDKGNAIILNKQAETLLGWDSSEVIGKNWHAVSRLEDEGSMAVADAERPLSRALSVKGRVTSSDYYFVRKNGVRFPVSITASTVALNGIIGAVEVFRDITKEKEIDRAKSEFISLASHQLRTPLSATKWLIELLMEGKLTEEQKTNIRDLAIFNERLINLVNDLLNISRLESAIVVANSKMVDIKSLVEDSVKLFKPKADLVKKKINFLSEFDFKEILLDPILFKEAFDNILDNAISYSSEKSVIEVKIVKDKDDCVISVHNEGVSIPSSDWDKLFTRFYRGDEAKKMKPEGSGLGLFIAKSAIEANGGKISFKAGESSGVTFLIELPIKREKGI